MHDTPLEDWFYECASLAPKLEALAKSHVTRWEWSKGGHAPAHDPDPYFAWRRGLALARGVKQKPAAKLGHFECGLDDGGRLHVVRHYTRSKLPGLTLYLHLAGRIRAVVVRDGSAAPVIAVKDLALDERGRVVESRLYSNVFGFPARLTPAAIRAHQQGSTVTREHQRYVWKGERLERIDTESVRGEWALQFAFEYAAGGKLERIWRPYGAQQQQVWPK